MVILDQDLKDTAEAYANIPFYYNCQANMSERSNGALDGSSTAFEINDRVHVRYTLDSDNKKEFKIVGFIEDMKACGVNLVIVVIDDDDFLSYDDDQDKIKYYKYEYKIKKGLELTTMPEPTVNISINGDGLILVIQGSENKNANIAVLPNKFTYFEFWDVRDDGSQCRWGVTVQLFMGTWSCVMGAKSAYNPMQGIAGSFSARTNYKLITDNQTATKNITAQTGVEVYVQENLKSVTVKNASGSTGYTVDTDYTVDYSRGMITVKSGGAITDGDSLLISYSYLTMTCYYKLSQTMQGQGLYYRDDLQPSYWDTSKYEMLYKTNPGSSFIGTALISQDYETSNPFADGYEWKIYNPVVAISDTEAVVLSIKRLQIKSPYVPRTYGYMADFTASSAEWGVCYEPGQCFLGGASHYGKGRIFSDTYHATGTVSLRKEHIEYTEELRIGDEVILSAVLNRKSETGFNEGEGIIISPSGTLMSQDISYECALQPDGHMCFTWDVTCPDGFDGGVTSDCEAINRAFPTVNGTCGVWGHPGLSGAAIIVPGNAQPSSIVGSGGIHVMAVANTDGKNSRIIIYQYTEYDIHYYVDGSSDTKTTTKYIVDIKSPAVTSSQTVAEKIVENGASLGYYISRGSCQINSGILTYTYCKYSAAGAFVSRVIKIINLSNSSYPAGQTYETESATDMGIGGSLWPKMMAIGVTK